MSENRIRKGDMVPPSGPASAGIRVTSDNSLRINPDGTEREVGPFTVTTPVVAATTDGVVWVAPYPCKLVKAIVNYRVASTSGTLMLRKVTGTTATASGNALFAANVDLAATAGTAQVPALTTTVADLAFAAGDRLGVDIGGTMTSLADGSVTAVFRQL